MGTFSLLPFLWSPSHGLMACRLLIKLINGSLSAGQTTCGMAVPVMQHCIVDVRHASTLAAVPLFDAWPVHCAFGSCHALIVHKDVSMAAKMIALFVRHPALVYGCCMTQLAE